ncbi:DUF6907 domain-containing protein [Streptomyces xiangluensis]|uniref:DUF6907 domain-containing protein n=1 Tax=Streptomyces xiangluensis TaxID=2665720 RepID=A0ABV8YU57_9ACTN
MSAEPRTVVVSTLDHGDITVRCPAWCIGAHPDGGYRADILHQGPDVSLAFHGRHITDAGLVQSPFAGASSPGLGGRTTGVSISILGKTLDPVGLYGLAAAIDGYADRLRDLADELAALLGGDQ